MCVAVPLTSLDCLKALYRGTQSPAPNKFMHKVLSDKLIRVQSCEKPQQSGNTENGVASEREVLKSFVH